MFTVRLITVKGIQMWQVVTPAGRPMPKTRRWSESYAKRIADIKNLELRGY